VPTLLSINNYFYRRDAADALYFEHNRLFAGSGWNVVPFSMHHPLNAASAWSRHFVDELELGRDYSLLQKAARVPKVIYSLEARRKIRRVLGEARPDIAHCHNIYHHLSPSILGSLQRHRVPTVMTLHDFKIACPAYHMFDGRQPCEKCRGGKVHNVLTNRCIKGSLALSAVVMTEALVQSALRSYASSIDRFVSPCRFYIDKLVEWGWPRQRFVHVPHFVDEASFRPRYEPGRAILYFGPLAPEKGVTKLVEAAAASKTAVRIAGEGVLAEPLRDLASRLGADVTFLGELEGEARIAEIQAARATVLPAEWYESTPLSVLESYALGKPAIGADIGGIPELIRHDVTGWTFRAGSVDALASVLRSVSDMPDMAIAETGRRARALVESDFSRARYHHRMLGVYRDLGIGADARGKTA
jgi:glycosyltransferase involved in cell wall biosynthesis